MKQNYFKILEINNDATIEEVKQAYRDLAQIWHPDRVSTKNPRLKEKAEKKMKELNKAKSKITAYLTEKQERKTEKCSEWEEKKERERATREQAERERAERERATRKRTEATKKAEQIRKKAEEEFFRKRAEQIAAEAKAKKNENDDEIPLYPPKMSDSQYRTIRAIGITLTIMDFCIVALLVLRPRSSDMFSGCLYACKR